MDTLKKLTCVYIDMRLWEGRKKLTVEDLQPAGLNETPPEELMSLGSKRIFPAEPLRPFYAMRKQAERLCEEFGTRFMDGFIIPAKRRETLAAELDKLSQQFTEKVEELLTDYDQNLETFVAKFPRWEKGIRSALLAREEVRERFRFRRVFFDLMVPEGMDESSHIERELDGIAGQVLHEVSQTASEVVGTSLAPDKEEARQSTRRILKDITDKVLGFAFIDKRLSALAARLEAVYDSLPDTGMILKDDFKRLRETFVVLADPKKAGHPENIPAAKPRRKVATPAGKRTEQHGGGAGDLNDSVL